ncbi:hypothetical protein [uncultured Desulfovibrio sp.]|uniref:hypothetical protein n=1 Tax=uncultured Desulfovibrio sp. TaxID=167968 RepID=UPI0003A272D0
MEKRPDRLALFLLPPYNPELNPDGLLIQDLKNNVRGKQRAATRSGMARAVRSFLRGRQRVPAIVKLYFTLRAAARAA